MNTPHTRNGDSLSIGDRNLPAGIRPSPFIGRRYAAFRLCHGLHARPSVLPIANGIATLEEAVSAALTSGKIIYHKDKLVIRETDDRGTRLHIYAIRKKAAQWIHAPGEYLPKRVEDHYAYPVCVVDAELLGAGS